MSTLITIVFCEMLLGSCGSLEDVKLGSGRSQENRVDENVSSGTFLWMRVSSLLVELHSDFILNSSLQTNCWLHFDVSRSRVDSSDQEVIRWWSVCTESISFCFRSDNSDLNVLPSNRITCSIVANDDVVLLRNFDHWIDSDNGSLVDLSESLSSPCLLVWLSWPLASLHFSTSQIRVFGFVDVVSDVSTVERRVSGFASSSTESFSTLALST